MKVVARLCPSGGEAIVSQLDTCLVLDPGSCSNNRRVRQHQFPLDAILNETASQEQLFDAVNVVPALVAGHNATVFAYGATGCGKTHTITGTPEDPGLVFRAMQSLFDTLNNSANVSELSLSYLEIYNEQIRDLLQPQTPSAKLNILEVDNDSIKITNLTRVTPVSLSHVYDLIVRANGNRTVSPTHANAASSRSHAILQINLFQSTNSGLHDEITQSTLNIIDLAGSERASSTCNKGKTLHEGANINKSLLALGSCISALSDSKPHIPYRNSKLTRLLKYSLGGNCQTCMIVCLAPDLAHFDDSLNALKYANMARNIKSSSSVTKNVVQRHIGDYENTIKDQQRVIDDLKAVNDDLTANAIESYNSQLGAISHRIDAIVTSVESSIEATMSDPELFITSCFNTHLSELSLMPGWSEITQHLYDSQLHILLLKHRQEDSTAQETLSTLRNKLNSLLDSSPDDLYLQLHGLLESTTTSNSGNLTVRKRRQHVDQYNTPRKSSRISSLNIQMGDINIDTTDDSIDQTSPQPQTRIGLTTKRLIASPKVLSPNRMANYQTNLLAHDSDSQSDKENLH